MKKKRRRRSPQRSLQAKLRRNMFVIVVFVLLFGWGIFSAVTWQGFRPQRVEVTGTSRVSPSAIRTAAQISLKKNIWLINPWALSTRVEAIPYVSSVRLERGLPNRVTLAIEERKPDSCVIFSGGRVTIDDTQRIVETGCTMSVSFALSNVKNARAGMTLSDPPLGRLRADAKTLADQHIEIKSASFDRDGGLTAVMRDGTLLLLGEDSILPQTSELLGPIISAVKKQGRSVSQIDVRAPSTPVVRYKESPVRTVKPRVGA